MTGGMRFIAPLAGILLLPVLLVACGDGDAGLTRAEAEDSEGNRVGDAFRITVSPAS